MAARPIWVPSVVRSRRGSTYKRGHEEDRFGAATILEVGTSTEGVDVCEYPDIDLRYDATSWTQKDGTKY